MPEFNSEVPLLTKKPPTVFADGSFMDDARIGAWAFYVPQIPLIHCQAATGRSVQEFEVLGIVRGLEELVRRQVRRARVFTDCSYTRDAILEFMAKPTPNAGSEYDELRELAAVLQKIRVSIVPFQPNHANHRRCHIAAKAAARRQLQSDARLMKQVMQSRRIAAIQQALIRRDRILSELKIIDKVLMWSCVEVFGCSHEGIGTTTAENDADEC